MEGLTKDEAVALCRKVREQNQAVISAPGRMQCRNCRRMSGDDPDRMYMAARPGYLGCDLINGMRARLRRARTP
jgi:hypothetical protein